MNKEQALQLQAEGKPCYYTGKNYRYLKGQEFYIKHVTSRTAIVTATPLLKQPGNDNYHEIKLENLTPAEAVEQLPTNF